MIRLEKPVGKPQNRFLEKAVLDSQKPRSRPSALESARVVFTLPWSLLPRTRAYVGGTLKKSR